MGNNPESPALLPLVGVTANELAFALFLIGLVYLAVSLPALARLGARLGGRDEGPATKGSTEQP
jgi:hypothetical protein